MNQISTIGHSIYEINEFVKLLQKHNINTIVDVRSSPYSKFASQYNKDALHQHLKENNIFYIFMGNLLGARYDDKSLLFSNGKVNFKKVQASKLFLEGIARLEKGMSKGFNIALMCSEKEAFDCHRFGLISEYLFHMNIEIQHIYPTKVLSQKELEEQLLKKYEKKIDFLGVNNIKNPIEQAYELRNHDIGYNSITKEGDEE